MKKAKFQLTALASMTLEELLDERRRTDRSRMSANEMKNRANHDDAVRWGEVVDAVGNYRFPGKYNEWDSVK